MGFLECVVIIVLLFGLVSGIIGNRHTFAKINRFLYLYDDEPETMEQAYAYMEQYAEELRMELTGIAEVKASFDPEELGYAIRIQPQKNSTARVILDAWGEFSVSVGDILHFTAPVSPTLARRCVEAARAGRIMDYQYVFCTRSELKTADGTVSVTRPFAVGYWVACIVNLLGIAPRNVRKYSPWD